MTAAFDSEVKGSDLESEAVASDLEVLGQKVSKVVEEREECLVRLAMEVEVAEAEEVAEAVAEAAVLGFRV